MEQCWEGTWSSVGRGHGAVLGGDMEQCWEGTWSSVGRGHGAVLGGDMEQCWEGTWSSVGRGHGAAYLLSSGWMVITFSSFSKLMFCPLASCAIRAPKSELAGLETVRLLRNRAATLPSSPPHNITQNTLPGGGHAKHLLFISSTLALHYNLQLANPFKIKTERQGKSGLERGVAIGRSGWGGEWPYGGVAGGGEWPGEEWLGRGVAIGRSGWGRGVAWGGVAGEGSGHMEEWPGEGSGLGRGVAWGGEWPGEGSGLGRGMPLEGAW